MFEHGIDEILVDLTQLIDTSCIESLDFLIGTGRQHNHATTSLDVDAVRTGFGVMGVGFSVRALSHPKEMVASTLGLGPQQRCCTILLLNSPQCLLGLGAVSIQDKHGVAHNAV
ncbi:hypothetical protein D3C84_878700 [compost metagenome]